MNQFYIGPFSEGRSQEELEFKRFLKSAFNASWEAFNKQDFVQVLTIWEPVLDNDYFRIGSPHWDGKPKLQYHVQQGRIHIALSACLLGIQEGYNLEKLKLAYHSLVDLLAIGPYSMDGPSTTSLYTKEALKANKVYLEYLDPLYKNFYDNILPWLKNKDEISSEEDASLCDKMIKRKAELEKCLSNHENA